MVYSSEFALIQQFFSQCGAARDDVVLGVGDDAALLRTPNGRELVITQDSLVSGVHFPPDTHPAALGHKTLAVNLSDLAAMGATPAWATLALTLPHADTDWLAAFSQGFCHLAQASGVRLIGGDTTRGPLNLSVTLIGHVAAGQALRRSGARDGDWVCVSGTLGDAGLALRAWQRSEILEGGAYLRERLDRPTPRLVLGNALLGLASAAIDISDGLIADLKHILEASGMGAILDVDCVPQSPAFRAWQLTSGDATLALTAGDDYELCFTLPAAHWPKLQSRLINVACPITRIGTITAAPDLHLCHANGSLLTLNRNGYEHFAAPN